MTNHTSINRLLQIIPSLQGQQKLHLPSLWSIGQCLQEWLENMEEQEQKTSLKKLGAALKAHYGSRYSESALKKYLQFYQCFPYWEAHLNRLSWSQLSQIIKIEDPLARDFYLQKCASKHWSSTQLKRQISSHFYERNAAQMELSKPLQKPKKFVFEFTSISPKNHFEEKQLENELIRQLPFFFLELGQDFAFVAQQQRLKISQEKSIIIDLVLYNYKLKCFTLIELKNRPLQHIDIGQLDFYRRFYDQNIKAESDANTVGLLLGTAASPSLLEYTLLKDCPFLQLGVYQLSFMQEKKANIHLTNVALTKVGATDIKQFISN